MDFVNEDQEKHYIIQNLGITAAVEGMTPLDSSINPLQTVSLPGRGPGDVPTMLRQDRFLGFHPDFDRPVYQNFMVITAGDVPTLTKIGPDNSW